MSIYLPAAFAEESLSVMHEAIRGAGLATLITVGADGPVASHVPMLLEAEAGTKGRLLGHLAKANPQARGGAGSALAIFLGPDAYISPSFYATKRETGKVVPTWNYVAVHASGSIAFFDDPARLRDLVGRLTERHEGIMPEPWAVEDAPADFIQAQLKGIIGFELTIERLEGKWKMSQNRTPEDRRGVVAGLGASEDATRRAVGRIVEERLTKG